MIDLATWRAHVSLFHGGNKSKRNDGQVVMANQGPDFSF